MRRCAMVNDMIDDDCDASCVRLLDQLVEIVKTSIVSFNLTKVAYCIAMITILTLSNRHQPERSDA